MGMIGVGEFERRALRATEKKALKQEAKAKNENEWRLNKESYHQKHYRVMGNRVSGSEGSSSAEIMSC